MENANVNMHSWVTFRMCLGMIDHVLARSATRPV